MKKKTEKKLEDFKKYAIEEAKKKRVKGGDDFVVEDDIIEF